MMSFKNVLWLCGVVALSQMSYAMEHNDKDLNNLIGSYSSTALGIQALELSENLVSKFGGRQFVAQLTLEDAAHSTFHGHFAIVGTQIKFIVGSQELLMDYSLANTEEGMQLILHYEGKQIAKLIKNSPTCCHQLFQMLQLERSGTKMTLFNNYNIDDPVPYLKSGDFRRHSNFGLTSLRDQISSIAVSKTESPSKKAKTQKEESVYKKKKVKHRQVKGLTESQLDQIELNAKKIREECKRQLDELLGIEEHAIEVNALTVQDVVGYYVSDEDLSDGSSPEIVSIHLKDNGAFEGRRNYLMKQRTSTQTITRITTKLIDGDFTLKDGSLTLILKKEDGKDLIPQELYSIQFANVSPLKLIYKNGTCTNTLRRKNEDKELELMKLLNQTSRSLAKTINNHYTY